eukprot:1442435-Amphidinium_carterae.1
MAISCVKGCQQRQKTPQQNCPNHLPHSCVTMVSNACALARIRMVDPSCIHNVVEQFDDGVPFHPTTCVFNLDVAPLHKNMRAN